MKTQISGAAVMIGLSAALAFAGRSWTPVERELSKHEIARTIAGQSGQMPQGSCCSYSSYCDPSLNAQEGCGYNCDGSYRDNPPGSNSLVCGTVTNCPNGTCSSSGLNNTCAANYSCYKNTDGSCGTIQFSTDTSRVQSTCNDTCNACYIYPTP